MQRRVMGGPKPEDDTTMYGRLSGASGLQTPGRGPGHRVLAITASLLVVCMVAAGVCRVVLPSGVT